MHHPCHHGVDVLVAALMCLALLLLIGIALFRLPKGRTITLLDLLVLFASVALAGEPPQNTLSVVMSFPYV